MKNIYLTSIMIIVAVSVDKIEDKISDDEFKQTTENFIAHGSRNTAEQGKHLCKRVNVLEDLQGMPIINCDEVYK